MGYIARPAVALRGGKRLHQMPAGEVGTSNIADLAALYQRIECTQHLLDRRERVEAMHGVDIDMVCIQSAQTVLTGSDQVMA